MNSDKIKGKMKETKAKIKQSAGKTFDDKEMRAEGALEEAEGKVQKNYGKLKD